MAKVLFLQTKQNHVWTSMQEILPHIQRVWEKKCQRDGHEITVVDVDQQRPHEYSKEILTCTHIVVCAFNLKIVAALQVIRGKLGVNSPLYFYLHNQATIGLWPLQHFKLFSFLRESDVFMGTCEGDSKCMNLLGLACENTLFASEDNLSHLPALKEEKIKDIVFIGRVSRQKNLHLLILAFQKICETDSSLKLHIYGKEDGLGSPNMELKKSGYLNELKELAGHQVFFHGFVEREKIKDKWKNKPFLFCSPSLHSDENFGMAALMALELGARAVLSSWGGHKNFLSFFPKRVFPVSVHIGKYGPFLNINELREALELGLSGKELGKVSSPFFDEQILNSLSIDHRPSSRSLNLPQLTKKLLAKKSGEQKVFEDYCDQDAHQFFKAYGARPSLLEVRSLFPWVKKEGNLLKIKDPHRGEFSINENEVSEFGCGWP